MTLPPELRLEIYEFTLYTHYSELNPKTALNRTIEHPLNHTCRLMRKESLPVYGKALDMYLTEIRALAQAACNKLEAHYQFILDHQAILARQLAAGWNRDVYTFGMWRIQPLMEQARELELELDDLQELIELEEEAVQGQKEEWGLLEAARDASEE